MDKRIARQYYIIMLCEDCQEREATVHMAVVSWRSGEINKHRCDSCYPAAEAARAKSCAAQPSAPLPSNVEDLTATEYLRLSARAVANSADKAAFKHLCRELEGLPVTRARLGVELLWMALLSLEQGNDPYNLIGLGGCFGNSTQTQKSQEYVNLLERIVVRSFERLAQSPKPPSAHPFGFGLTLAVIALRRTAPVLWATVLAALKDPTAEKADQRRLIMDYVEQHIAKAGRTRNRRRRSND